jgi:hypothetical protein
MDGGIASTKQNSADAKPTAVTPTSPDSPDSPDSRTLYSGVFVDPVTLPWNGYIAFLLCPHRPTVAIVGIELKG